MRQPGSRSYWQKTDTDHAPRQVFCVDGDSRSTDIVGVVLRQLDARITRFDHPNDCLYALRSRECHLVVSNTKRPAIEGMILLLGAKVIAPSVPVVVMVDHGDIQGAVRAMKAGAVDCLDRPPEQKHLLSAIEAALRVSIQSNQPPRISLTNREDQVLGLILRGCTNGETAQRLCCSKRTVEVHRRHIMRKFEVDNVIELVRCCAPLGLLSDWSQSSSQRGGRYPASWLYRPRVRDLMAVDGTMLGHNSVRSSAAFSTE
jgi:FixJ family two-component response regulator